MQNKSYLKNTLIVLLIVVVILTIYVCAKLPKLHKPISLQTIEYALKFNTDGSVSTTKTITTTKMTQEEK